MSFGTNLGTRVTSTLWIAETEPVPSVAGGKSLATRAYCNGTPPTTANVFAHGCNMIQLDTSTGTPATYQNTGSSASPVWTLFDTALPGDTASSLIDTNSVTAMDVGTTASAVNNLRTTNAAAGSAPSLSSVGSDTNIAIVIKGKGTGSVQLGQATSTDVRLVADQPIADSSGNEFIKFTKAASAVNEVTVANAATGTAVALTATGGDTDIGMTLGAKGAGKLSLPGTGAKVTPQAWNYIASETGSNNAIAGALTDASAVAVPLVAGLRVSVLLAHSLQAGANTFVFNTVSKSIKSHRNPANDIGTAYVSGGSVELMYDGTQWQDMSQ